MHDIWKKRSKGSPRLFIGAIAVLVIIASIPVRAGEMHWLGLGTGIVGILDHDKSAYGCIEYRLPAECCRMNPWVSVEFSDSFFYGAAGLLVDFDLTKHLVFTPSFGAGFYSQDNGMKLGHPIEFRSSAELSWRFKNSSRLAVSFGHISNGGLDDTNPGSELLKVTWLVPFDFN
jgi:hypothetical protein